MMKKITTVISVIWFSFVGLTAPLCVGGIYMWISGHNKGYGYELGEGDAAVSAFIGSVMLLIWLLALLPVTVSLSKKCYRKKKSAALLPVLAFAGLFVAGICLLGGWDEFISLFGY